MSDLFNLDELVAGGEGQPFAFTWGGQLFELPALSAMPIQQQMELIDAIDGLDSKDAAKVLAVLKLIVGDLLDRLTAARPISSVALVRLIGAWMEHQGLGKSSALPPSSASTEPKSRPTSRSGQAHRTS